MARMASQSTTRQIRAEKYWNWTKKQPGPEKIQGQLQPPEGCSPCFGRPTLVQGQGQPQAHEDIQHRPDYRKNIIRRGESRFFQLGVHRFDSLAGEPAGPRPCPTIFPLASPCAARSFFARPREEARSALKACQQRRQHCPRPDRRTYGHGVFSCGPGPAFVLFCPAGDLFTLFGGKRAVLGESVGNFAFLPLTGAAAIRIIILSV